MCSRQLTAKHVNFWYIWGLNIIKFMNVRMIAFYTENYKNHQECPICKNKRYRTDLQSATVPSKVLRHMPIIPRLQRIFRCKSLAQLMDWHAKNRSKDRFM